MAEDLVAEIEALEEKLAEAKRAINSRFIGQERVVELTLASLLCGGHALLIGLPGLGKTRLVETLSTVMGLDGNRIQFTPDLMPADILGSEVLETGSDGASSDSPDSADAPASSMNACFAPLKRSSCTHESAASSAPQLTS